MFEIECKELTPGRKRVIAEWEVVPFNKPLRAVIAVGGAWIFFYGTSFDVPTMVQSVAFLFAAVGIAAVLFAIFVQKLIEMNFFSKAAKKGFFPAGVTVGEGGVFVRRREKKGAENTSGVTSVNAVKFYAFAEVGKINDYGDCFKLNLAGGTAGAFLFKEDFGKGDPEAFGSFIASKKAAV